jgi:hypothetical protein
MVGGKVVGIARGPESTLLHVEDTPYTRPEYLSIRVIERRRDNGQPVTIHVEDSVWWQAGWAMWTPATQKGRPVGECGKTWDIMLPRVGYSH